MSIPRLEQNSAVAVLALMIILYFIVSGTAVSAGPWKRSIDANLTVAQTAYTDNWKGGEAGNLTWTFNNRGSAARSSEMFAEEEGAVGAIYRP